MTNSPSDFNAAIIEEFRTNAGKVGGPFEGVPMLLLHTTGAKSGAERINPLAYQPLEDGWAVFASKAGATTNPDWYYNVRASGDVSIEVGTDTIEASAPGPFARGHQTAQTYDGKNALPSTEVTKITIPKTVGGCNRATQ